MFHTTSTTWRSLGLRFLSALASLLMMTALISVAVAGSLGRVTINSNPPGASILVGAQVVGTTPATLELPADQTVRVKLSKSGFKSRSVSITPREGKATRVTVKLKPG